MSLEDIRSARLHKLSLIEEAGIDPYPAHTDRTHEIADALGSFAKLEKQKFDITRTKERMAPDTQTTISGIVEFVSDRKKNVQFQKELVQACSRAFV